MKNILVPTDFSENAWNALCYGISFFKNTKCVFHIVHVSSISAHSSGEVAMYVSPEIVEKTILKDSYKKLRELLKKVEQLPLNPKHEFKIMAHYGFLTDHLKSEVQKKEIDLILMGTKGSSGLKAVAIGSNTGNVITKVPCTVMAVPERAIYQKTKEIGFPSDFQIKYRPKVLETIKEFLLMKKSDLRFLFVSLKDEEMSPSQFKNKTYLMEYFKDVTPSFHVVTGKKIDEAIQCFSESRDLDMLVMVAKNLNFLERTLFRPTVEKISYHIRIPFVIIHE